MFGAARTAFIGQAAALLVDEGPVSTRAGVNIEALADAQVDTSRYKFGSSSLLVDGTGDHLHADLDTSTIGTGAFTWECFFNVDNDTGDGTVAILSNRTGSPDAGDIQMLFRNFDMKVQVNIYTTGGSPSFNANGVGSALAVDTWHHYALVRDSSGNIGVFVNGTRVASQASNTTSISDANAGLGIGAHADGTLELNDGGSLGTDNGWVDEVRISNTARYDPTSSSLTVPTAAFTRDSNDMLLLHMEGSDGSTLFTDDVGINFRSDTYGGNVTLALPFDYRHGVIDQSPKISNNGTSAVTQGPASNIVDTEYYWTSPDYQKSLENASGLGAALEYALETSFPSAASGTYVIEAWVKAENSSGNSNWTFSSADSGGRWLFAFNSGTSTFLTGGENYYGLGDTNWHHFAAVCDAGTHRSYIDGEYVGGWGSSNTGFSTLHVGQFKSTDPNDFNGHLQDVRVTIGSNRGYTGTSSSSANFTLPSSIVESF